MRPINLPTAGRRAMTPRRTRLFPRVPETAERRPALFSPFIINQATKVCLMVIQRAAHPLCVANIFAADIDCNSIRRQTGVRVFRALDNFSRRAFHLLSDCAFARGVLCFPEHGGAAV